MTLQLKIIAAIEAHEKPESIASYANAYKAFSSLMSFPDFRERVLNAGYYMPSRKIIMRNL